MRIEQNKNKRKLNKKTVNSVNAGKMHQERLQLSLTSAVNFKNTADELQSNRDIGKKSLIVKKSLEIV